VGYIHISIRQKCLELSNLIILVIYIKYQPLKRVALYNVTGFMETCNIKVLSCILPYYGATD
jgi:hypothetical protein